MALSHIAKMAEIAKNATIPNHRSGHPVMDPTSTPQDHYPRWLLVDDLRVHPCTTVARTYKAGLAEMLRTKYDGLLLDYGLDAMGKEPTGLDLLRDADDHRVLPDKIIITSSHPTGKMKLADELQAKGYQYIVVRSDEGWFTCNGYWVRTREKGRGKRKVTVHLNR